jgi:hypothetical protein
VPRRLSWRRAALLVCVAFVVAGALLWWYAASDELPTPASRAILVSIMPAYDMQEVHATFVEAQPAAVYAAILAVTPGETALARPFFWMRTLPARMSGAPPIDDSLWNRPLVSESSPATLGRVAGREIVVGLIGSFWKLRSGERVAVESRKQFLAFNRPGFAVSTLSFHIDPEDGGTRVTTITRVRTTDPDARRAFRRYWRVIGTGSAVLRRTWLQAVKARAEK